MKNFILFVSFLFSVIISNAQENPVYPNGENVRPPSSQAWGILFSYGAINFNGDIKQYDFGTATQDFNGQMGPMQIYNKVLSASEVTQNYNALKNRFRT